MRQEVGLPNIGKMLLKRGDFIEDKFGQVQRDLLYEKGQVGESTVGQLFQWYGSYLCWWTATDEGVDSNEDLRGLHRCACISTHTGLHAFVIT